MAKIRIFNSQILNDAEPLDDGGFASPVTPEISFLVKESLIADNLNNVDLTTVENYSTYYYSTNDLILRLEENSPENFSQFDISPDGTISIFSIAYIKTKTLVTGPESQYIKLNYFNPLAGRELFDIISVNSERTQIQISFKDDKFFETYEILRTQGREIPEFGIIALSVPFVQGGRKFFQTFILKYTDKAILTTPPSVETNIPDEVSYTTPPYTFETFFIPTLSASFVYNFYELNEESLASAARKNYYASDFRQVPKYVKLSWSKAPILPASFYRNLQRLQNYFRSLSSSAGLLGSLAVPPPPEPEPETPPPSSPGAFLDGVYFDGGARNLSSIFQSSGRNSAISSALFDLGVGSELREGTTESSSPTIPSIRPGILTEEDEENLRRNVQIDIPGVSLPPTIPESIPDLINNVSRYVGYVIVKEIISEDGEVTPIDIIVVPDINTTTYYDFKIAYGKTYRYKIRSMFLFVNNMSIPDIVKDSDSSIKTSGSAQLYFGNVFTTNSYYFDSEFSDPVDLECLEFERPTTPELQVFPNSRKKMIFLTWTQKDSSRDVLGFNVYRKKFSDLNFSKLNIEPISKRNNFYIDEDVLVDQHYIYAIESVDVHFNFSKLSSQIVAKISNFEIQSSQLCEEDVQLYKVAGFELGEELKIFDKYKYFQKKFKVLINPIFLKTRENLTYILKIKSLDTGEEKEIKINFKTSLINTEPARIREEFQDEITESIVEQTSRAAEQVRDAVRQDFSRRLNGRF